MKPILPKILLGTVITLVLISFTTPAGKISGNDDVTVKVTDKNGKPVVNEPVYILDYENPCNCVNGKCVLNVITNDDNKPLKGNTAKSGMITFHGLQKNKNFFAAIGASCIQPKVCDKDHELECHTTDGTVRQLFQTDPATGGASDIIRIQKNK